jgi:ribosomal protein S18 acetylase RimI-like enzyme
MRAVPSEADWESLVSGFEIREATSADVDAVADAGRRFFTAAYGNISGADDLAAHVDDYFSKSAVANEIGREGVRYLLALEGGDIAGFIKLRRGPIPDDVPFENALEVQQLYVSPRQQRKGLGVLLTDRAVAVARDNAADALWLSVWQEAEGAVNFYRKYGYHMVGTAVFRLGHSRFTDYLMCLPISSDVAE